jgi:hypothetical protein
MAGGNKTMMVEMESDVYFIEDIGYYHIPQAKGDIPRALDIFRDSKYPFNYWVIWRAGDDITKAPRYNRDDLQQARAEAYKQNKLVVGAMK